MLKLKERGVVGLQIHGSKVGPIFLFATDSSSFGRRGNFILPLSIRGWSIRKVGRFPFGADSPSLPADSSFGSRGGFRYHSEGGVISLWHWFFIVRKGGGFRFGADSPLFVADSSSRICDLRLTQPILLAPCQRSLVINSLIIGDGDFGLVHRAPILHRGNLGFGADTLWADSRKCAFTVRIRIPTYFCFLVRFWSGLQFSPFLVVRSTVWLR